MIFTIFFRGSLLLTSLNFNPSTDKNNHIPGKVWDEIKGKAKNNPMGFISKIKSTAMFAI